MCRAAIDISLLWSERRYNLRRGIHRRGEVTSPDGLGNPTPTGSTVCDNTTLRSSGARGLEVSRCYRHIAPLERKAGQFAVRYPSSGRGCLAPTMGWGSQPLRIPRCATVPHCAPLERGDWMCRAAIDISLLWSERRHNLRRGIHRRGEVASPDGLGDPTPTGSTVCDSTTLRSSGARGLDVSRCYRHIAPLERKAGQFAVRYPSSGRGYLARSPTGWGTQPLRIQRCATIPHCAPLERGDWRCRAAIDISLLWSERRHNLRRGIHCGGEVSSPSGLGNPTPTNSTFPVSLRRCTLALKFPSRLAAHRELELVLQQHRVTLPSLPF